MTQKSNHIIDDTFLARWLAGDLSEGELKDFQAHPDYEHYKKIADQSDNLSAPHFDVETHLADFKVRIGSKPNVKKLSRRKMYLMVASAAAILLLGIWLTTGIFSAEHVSTQMAETQTTLLPDGSKVYLNAQSSLKYRNRSFDKERTIELQGEAFFEVTKGSTFTVNTPVGHIEVLGTSFNVRVLGNTLEVHCKTGSVEVTAEGTGESLILITGNHVLIDSQRKWSVGDYQSQFSTWRDGTSKFRSAPLHLVMEELLKYYDIEIEVNGLDLDSYYSGQFPQDDLTKALTMIFPPMGVNHQLNGNKLVLSK